MSGGIGRLALMSVFFAAAPLSLAEADGISDNDIRIGVLNDMSGLYSHLSGEGSAVAAQMAIDEFEAQFNPDFSIALYRADHQNKPEIASTRAHTWFDVDNVDMITDILTSSAALAVLKIAEEKNKLVIISGAAAPLITGEQCVPTGLHWTYNASAVAARAVVGEGGRTWYFMTADYVGGYVLEEAAENALIEAGGEVAGKIAHPFPGQDFSSFLLSAQASGADVIGLANAGNDTINSIKQAAEFGINRTQSLAATLLFITDVQSLDLEAAQGMYLTEAFYWDFDEQGRMPTMIQAGVYQRCSII